MRYVLALDQGTTSSRAILFDAQGRPVAVGQQEFTQYFPRASWVEHDPEEIYATQVESARAALATAGVAKGDVAAIGITNQRETTIVWDRKTGAPIHPAIVWQDRRTTSVCEELIAAGHQDDVRRRTGLVLDPYFSGTKIAWLLDHVEGARARAEAGELAFGTVDTWLTYRLTGGAVHVTDASNACRTLLYDLRSGDWSDELLALFRVPRAMLPEIRSSSEVYGEVSTVDELNGRPIASLVGDQQAATMGQVCTKPGLAKNTYGTGCFLLMNAGPAVPTSEHQLLGTVGWRLGGADTFALEGSVFVGGAAVQWLRDGLELLPDAPTIEALARSVASSDGVIFVPALAGLGAPDWDPNARGAFFGLTRGTTRAHVARATLEGIALQVSDLLVAMEADAGKPLAELRVDGGAAANDLLLQTQADILQRPVIRPTCLETTALGAAYLAGLAVGVWGSIEELSAHWQVDRRFEPAIPASEAESVRARWRAAIDATRAFARA